MTLSPFQANKLVEWAEWKMTHGSLAMPRGIAEMDRWVYRTSKHWDIQPFPKFDTEQPYTWEG